MDPYPPPSKWKKCAFKGDTRPRRRWLCHRRAAFASAAAPTTATKASVLLWPRFIVDTSSFNAACAAVGTVANPFLLFFVVADVHKSAVLKRYFRRRGHKLFKYTYNVMLERALRRARRAAKNQRRNSFVVDSLWLCEDRI